jgi:hypothetical protein
MLKYLRIAVTALSLTACVLLTVLWVWTADNGDNFQKPLFEVSGFAVYSTDGIIWAVKAEFVKYSPPNGIIHSFYMPPRYQATPDGFASTAIHKGRGFDMQVWSPRQWFVQAPNWFPVLAAAAVSIVPWIKWRFSLRTLLIAMALVAMGLGIIVAAT